MNVEREAKYFLLLLHLLLQLSSTVIACPRACFCNTISRIAYCSRKGLLSIPHGIPGDTYQLNLNENRFQTATLKRQNFSTFTELEHLYLSDCGIRAIEVGTFIDLVNLKWLDLSKNKIKDIQDFTFRGLNLEQLFLNGNEGLVMHKDTFNGLKAQGLYLHNCGLHEIKSEILRPINQSLQNLWLSNNRIKRLDAGILEVFKGLTHLRFHANPLHCNCRLKWFKKYYDDHVPVFDGAPPPSCETPSHAQSRGFNGLAVSDFRCQPPIFNDVDLLFSQERGVLSCSASGDPAPTLYWIRPTGEKETFHPSIDVNAVKTDGKLDISHVEGVYTGKYECLASNDGGNVTLRMNVSWPKIETVIQFVERPAISPTKNAEPTQKDEEMRRKSPAINNQQHENINMLHHRAFSMLELVCAVLGTFGSTVLMCLTVFHILYRFRTLKVPRNRLENGFKPKENLYLDNKNEEDIYMGIHDVPHVDMHNVRR